MNLDKLASLLAKHEGVRLGIYTDSVGKVSVGIGHNLTDKGLTLSQVEMILRDDIKDTLAFLDSRLPWWTQLDEVRQVALADIAFNLMHKLLDFHHMQDALQQQDWERAATELLNSKFAAQTGKRAQDVAQMIRTGQYLT